MANTSVIYARIDSNLKDNAEGILSQLGISPSGAIQMLYSQIVMTKGLPLDLHIPSQQPTTTYGITREQLDAQLQKGMESLRSGRTYSVEEVDEELSKEFRI